MNDPLGIVFTIIFLMAPKDIETVQIWPNAVDANAELRQASFSFSRTTNGWCSDSGMPYPLGCVTISNGICLNNHGQVLLRKDDLKIANGTNYTFKPDNHDGTLEFSVRQENDEKTLTFKAG